MQLQTVLIVVLAVIVLAVLGIILFLPTQAPLPAAAIAAPASPALESTAPVQAKVPQVQSTSFPVAPANLQPIGRTVTGPETAASIPNAATQ